jgi:hypothetical protein
MCPYRLGQYWATVSCQGKTALRGNCGDAYQIRDATVSFKFGPGEAAGLVARGRVADAPRPAQNSPIQGQHTRPLEKLWIGG